MASPGLYNAFRKLGHQLRQHPGRGTELHTYSIRGPKINRNNLNLDQVRAALEELRSK